MCVLLYLLLNQGSTCTYNNNFDVYGCVQDTVSHVSHTQDSWRNTSIHQVGLCNLVAQDTLQHHVVHCKRYWKCTTKVALEDNGKIQSANLIILCTWCAVWYWLWQYIWCDKFGSYKELGTGSTRFTAVMRHYRQRWWIWRCLQLIMCNHKSHIRRRPDLF